MIPAWLQGEDGSVTVSLYVQPRASRNQLVGEQDGEIKVRLTAPPVEGAANELCSRFFAKLLNLPRRDVTVAAGERSRHKRLMIRGLSIDQVRRTLEQALA